MNVSMQPWQYEPGSSRSRLQFGLGPLMILVGVCGLFLGLAHSLGAAIVLCLFGWVILAFARNAQSRIDWLVIVTLMVVFLTCLFGVLWSREARTRTGVAPGIPMATPLSE
jgi:cell division protein FtsW (lipid II flippase)